MKLRRLVIWIIIKLIQLQKIMRICMVSDFFFPHIGGVQVHVYELSKQLTKRGHHIIIVTHQYQSFKGVRWLTPNIKVYYLPFLTFKFNTIIPTYLLTLPIARQILLRQKIQITHSHQSSSVLAGEFCCHSRLLGIRTVHTQHSLFGFSDITSFNLNKVATIYHLETDKIICVSRKTRDNMILRTGFQTEKFIVIPNAIDSNKFKLRKKKVKNQIIKLITVGRLYFRKGIDLLVQVIPIICSKYQNIQWTIIGDGPKKYLIQFLINKYNLQNKIKLLGKIQHYKINVLLQQADIFINPSLTESFGIAVIQAGAVGILCVSTNVGGISEILPEDILILTQPTSSSLIIGIQNAIHQIHNNTYCPNQNISKMYNWTTLVDRTQQLYFQILKMSKKSQKERIINLIKKDRFSLELLLIVILLSIVILRVLQFFDGDISEAINYENDEQS